jgi:hypothetical protein
MVRINYPGGRPIIIMILDEKILINDRKDALELAEWLRKRGCMAGVTETFDSRNEEIITGSIDALDKWLTVMAEEDDDNSEKYAGLKEINQNYKKAVSEVLDGKSAGDLIYTHDDIKASAYEVMKNHLNLLPGGLDSSGYGISPEYSSDRFRKEIFREIPLSMIHSQLKYYEGLRETKTGFTLISDLKPGNVKNEISITKNDIRYNGEFPGIEYRCDFFAGLSFEVSLPFPSYFLADENELSELLLRYNLRPDYTEEFLMRFMLKRNLVNNILRLVDDNKAISPSSLRQKLQEYWSNSMRSGIGRSEITITPDLAERLTEELKSAGILTERANRLKLSNTAGKKI